jgi:hypothetical protein
MWNSMRYNSVIVHGAGVGRPATEGFAILLAGARDVRSVDR